MRRPAQHIAPLPGPRGFRRPAPAAWPGRGSATLGRGAGPGAADEVRLRSALRDRGEPAGGIRQPELGQPANRLAAQRDLARLFLHRILLGGIEVFERPAERTSRIRRRTLASGLSASLIAVPRAPASAPAASPLEVYLI